MLRAEKELSGKVLSFMVCVTTYTFTENGRCSARSRNVSPGDVEKTLEEATATAEGELGRTRIPFSDRMDTGYQVGDGSDPQYRLILVSRY